MTKKSNKSVRNRVFRYNPDDSNAVSYKQIKKIAMDIALKEINKQSAILMNICMMAYLDIMNDIKETHPMIDKTVIDPIKFRDIIEKYISDYDNGIFNEDHLKNYVGKYRVRKIFYADPE